MSEVDFISVIEEHETAIMGLKTECIEDIEKIAGLCRQTLKNGHTIFLCGNGGSAADSQHIAAEFVGRFVKERRGLPAAAFTTDTSILTAVGNDYGYDEVFRRQAEALVREGDLLIGISTSGNSENVVKALLEAKNKGAATAAFTGMKESKMSAIADVTLRVPHPVTARVQECHILAGHIICQYVDEEY